METMCNYTMNTMSNAFFSGFSDKEDKRNETSTRTKQNASDRLINAA